METLLISDIIKVHYDNNHCQAEEDSVHDQAAIIKIIKTLQLQCR